LALAYEHFCADDHQLPLSIFISMQRPPRPTLFPYTTLFRSEHALELQTHIQPCLDRQLTELSPVEYSILLLGAYELEYSTGLSSDRKSTRLNSSHVKISYAVFCLKKKTKTKRYAHHDDKSTN